MQPGHVACYSHVYVEEELAALLDFLSFYCFPRMTQWARSSSLVVLYPVYYLRSSHWLQCAFLSTLRSTLPLKALQALSKRLDPLSKIPLFSILTLLNITSSSILGRHPLISVSGSYNTKNNYTAVRQVNSPIY